MSSFLWSSGFGAHKYRLSLPTIADVMDIADCAFARTSSILHAINQAHNIKTTFSLDVANETTKDMDAEPIQVVEETTSVDIPFPASTIEEIEPTMPIATDRDEFPIFAPNAEVHSYPHVASPVEIVEISTTSSPDNIANPVEDIGASASSAECNDFERFLDEDRMWGVPRPAKRKPLILFSKVVGKTHVVPMNSEEESGKKVVAATSLAIGNAAEGAANACSSSYLPQPDDIISQRERKLSTDTNVSTETRETVDTDKSTDAVATTPDTVSSCADVTTKPDCDTQTPAIPEINFTEPSEIYREGSNDIEAALGSDSGIPTRDSLPPFTGLYDYSSINFTQEDLRDIWIMTILTRPGYAVEYAKLNCGFWYIIEDKKSMRMMVEPEYQEFLQWIAEVNAPGPVVNHNNEPEVKEPEINELEVDEQHNRPKHLASKPADQNSNGLEILEEYLEENEDIAEEEEEEEDDWAELLRWKKRYELGRGWAIVKSFNHPDYADRKYALANDSRWYFEYKGKYRRLMEDEMDLLNRRREDGSALVDAAEEHPVTNRWGLATIIEEEEEE